MSYIVNKSNGELLTELVDGTVDQDVTNLTLIGKNVSGYGEFINENFVRLLENFANSSPPDRPILGQLWFDTTENRLKVYNGSGFNIGSSSRIGDTRPGDLTEGDFWINASENQLYFYDGQDTVLVGPLYKTSQGISGFETETIVDINGYEKVILKLWVGQELLGIFSKELSEFYPMVSITGFDGPIKPGFNQSNLRGLKFNVTASAADALVVYDTNNNPTYKPTSSFVSVDTDSYINATVNITSLTPLVLGSNNNNAVTVNENTFELKSNISGQDYVIKTKFGSSEVEALRIDGDTAKVTGKFVANGFKLPRYTTSDRDTEYTSLTSDDYGEMIYNLTTNKVQVYTSTGWIDLN